MSRFNLTCAPRAGIFTAFASILLLASCSGEHDHAGHNTPDVTDGTDASTPEIRDDAYWAELAQSYPAFVPEPGLGAAIPPDEYIVRGRWGDVIDWPEIATGAAHFPDGRVMTWSSTSQVGFGGIAAFTYGSIFDPVTAEFSESNNDYHNTFCAGVAMLPDGRTIAAGGGATIKTTSTYDELIDSWTLDEDMNFPRWYPTSTTLPSGQVLTSLGTIAQPYSELWTENLGWDLRTDLSLQSILTDQSAYAAERHWYPTLNVSPDGSLFHSGPTSELLSLHVSDEHGHDHGVESHGQRENGDPHRLYGTSVMYDIGKMLIAGGGKPALASAMTVDLNSGSPQVTPINSMNHARSMQNSVVMPDGKVLVIGGNSSGLQFSDTGTQLIPEMWDPDSGLWQELAPHEKPRNYHSTALLLKDGRVAAMGGGLCGGCLTNQKSGEIFEPPYLFNADGTEALRPEIISGASVAAAGDSITLEGSDDIIEFNMVRLVALTHHHTTDQRLIPLSIESSASGNFQVSIPDNVNVVIPGNYWIFGLNSQGVPSHGHTINVSVTTTAETYTREKTNSVTYEYFEGEWDNLPDFSSITPLQTGKLESFLLLPAQRDDNFAFRYSATLRVPTDGQYTFFTTSDDGTELRINGQLVVDNGGLHGRRERNGSIVLTAGDYDLELTYFDQSGAHSLAASWSGPNFDRQDLSTGLVGEEAAAISNLTMATSEPDSVNYEYYEGTWNVLPDFDALTPVSTGQQNDFSLSPATQEQRFAIRFTATVQAPTTGQYTFYTASDDGSQLFIDGQLVVDNDGVHPHREESGSIVLDAGTHTIVVTYFERWGQETLSVHWSGPDFEKQGFENGLIARPPEPNAENVNFAYYEGVWDNLPDFNTLSPITTGTVENFYLAPAQRIDRFAIRYTARIDVPETGDYTFYTSSDDGSRLWVNGALVVDNDGIHPLQERQGTVTLNAGIHDIVVGVFEKWGAESLDVKWSGPSISKQDLSGALLAPLGPVAGATDITYEYFEGKWNTLPDFTVITPVTTGNTDTFDLNAAQRDDLFAFRFTATLTVSEAGNHTFFTASDDGSQLFIDDQLVVNNDGIHPYQEVQETVFLDPGEYTIVVTFFEKWGGHSLDVHWSGPGFGKQPLAVDTTITSAEVTSVDISSSN